MVCELFDVRLSISTRRCMLKFEIRDLIVQNCHTNTYRNVISIFCAKFDRTITFLR